MYRYRAHVVKVVDGDTFDAIVDLGFKTSTKKRFRLKGVDTPETWRPKTKAEAAHGQKAKNFVTDLILDKFIIIDSVKPAVYGRWEAYVECPNGLDLTKLLKENNMEKLDEYPED